MRKTAVLLILSMVISNLQSIPVLASDVSSGSRVTLRVASGSDAPENPDIDNPDPDNPDPDNPEADTFSVTVPASIPIQMDVDGNIEISQTLKIINGNDKAIKCTGIDVGLDTNWDAIDFDTDLSTLVDGDKKVSLAFRGDKLDSLGTMAVTEDSWNFAANDSLPINAAAKIPKQAKGYTSSVASIDWTFDWSDNTDSSDPTIGEDLNDKPAVSDKYTVKFFAPEGAVIKGSEVVEVEKGESVTLPDVEPYGIREEVSGWKEADNTIITDKTITVNKDMDLTAVLNARAENPKNWFTSSGNVLTGLSSEYLNMIDAPTDLVIPNNVGGSSITSIGANAFKDKNLITSIVVPNTVTSIDVTAFSGCNANLKLDLSYSNRYGIAGAPWGINTSSNDIIWDNLAEAWDTNPKSASEIRAMCLKFNSGTIEQYAYNINVDPNLVLPTSVEGVKVTTLGTFKNNQSVRNITMSNTITSAVPDAVSHCDNLRGVVLSESLEEISSGMFYGCGNLTNIDIPSSVRSILSGAFTNTSIDTITIPNTVEVIADRSLYGIRKVVYDGDSSGAPWSALFVSRDGSEPAWDTDKVTSSDLASRGLAIKSTSTWGNGKSVKLIANSTSVTNVKIPTSVDGMLVNEFACEDNTIIERLEFPKESAIYSLDSPRGIIDKCPNLKEIVFSDSTTKMGMETVYDCKSLNSVTLPSNLEVFGIKSGTRTGPVFYYCGKLSTLDFSRTALKEIGTEAFKYGAFTSIIIPDSVTNIGSLAFQGVPLVKYSGTAKGSPWGASSVVPNN